jgi:hypothetical protein
VRGWEVSEPYLKCQWWLWCNLSISCGVWSISFGRIWGSHVRGSHVSCDDGDDDGCRWW